MDHPPIPVSELAKHINNLKADNNHKVTQEYMVSTSICHFLLHSRKTNTRAWGGDSAFRGKHGFSILGLAQYFRVSFGLGRELENSVLAFRVVLGLGLELSVNYF